MRNYATNGRSDMLWPFVYKLSWHEMLTANGTFNFHILRDNLVIIDADCVFQQNLKSAI
ncbi:conserved protein of unknown function [Paraburkholderia dioscoreae]|uniref:Uncharacterized protein n=1 Tax=Paraburkholderia dioscoreae TaxID=2604047 RepID=A0A5Q4Z9W3_9BURK|nr:conserved protein of unknown function [Paraburkholderia dioscoreae]